MGAQLNPGISHTNMVSFLLILFASEVAFHFVNQYTLFVLEDEKYYDKVDKDQRAAELGKISLYSKIVIIIA